MAPRQGEPIPAQEAQERRVLELAVDVVALAQESLPLEAQPFEQA